MGKSSQSFEERQRESRAEVVRRIYIILSVQWTERCPGTSSLRILFPDHVMTSKTTFLLSSIRFSRFRLSLFPISSHFILRFLFLCPLAHTAAARSKLATLEKHPRTNTYVILFGNDLRVWNSKTFLITSCRLLKYVRMLDDRTKMS